MMDGMSSTIEAITEIGIVPVVVIDDPGRAADLAYALLDGGIGCAEITLRTPGALQAIRAAAAVPGFVTAPEPSSHAGTPTRRRCRRSVRGQSGLGPRMSPVG